MSGYECEARWKKRLPALVLAADTGEETRAENAGGAISGRVMRYMLDDELNDVKVPCRNFE